MRQITRSATACLALALVTGCSNFGNIRLYSETRDKQGDSAKETWGAVGEHSEIATQRASNAALLAEQLKLEDAAARSRRDSLLLQMLVASDPAPAIGSVAGLVTDVEQLDKELTNGIDLGAEFTKVAKERKNMDALLPEYTREFRRLGVAVPSCAQVESGAANVTIAEWHKTSKIPLAEAVFEHLRKLKEWCTQDAAWYPRREKLFEGYGGRMGDAWSELQTSQQAIKVLKAEKVKAAQTYKDALTVYETEQKKLSVGASADERETLRQLAIQARRALDLVERTGDAFGAEFAARERLHAIEEFLAAIAETEPGKLPPATASRAARAFVLIPDTISSTKRWIADAEKPNLVPLVMRKNYEELNLEAASRRIKAMETKVALQRAKVDALQAQVDAYRNVKKLLQADKLGSTDDERQAVLRSRIVDVDKHKRPGQRVAIYNAISYYLDASGRLDAEVYKYDYRIAAVEHEANLSLAEVNVKQWQALIDASVDQLADYGTSGITKEQVTGFLNSATLLWIATGVN